jgi:hypothetical protein
MALNINTLILWQDISLISSMGGSNIIHFYLMLNFKEIIRQVQINNTISRLKPPGLYNTYQNKR